MGALSRQTLKSGSRIRGWRWSGSGPWVSSFWGLESHKDCVQIQTRLRHDGLFKIDGRFTGVTGLSFQDRKGCVRSSVFGRLGSAASFTSDTSKSNVFDVNESNFREKVINSSVPVILDFYADWCGPCKILGPILEEAVEAHGGKVVLAKLNSDENPAISQSLQVNCLPTVFAVCNGKLVDKFVGMQPEDVVREFVQRMVEQGSLTKTENGVSAHDTISDAEQLLEKTKEAFESKTVNPQQALIVFRHLVDLEVGHDLDETEEKRLSQVKALANACIARCFLLQGELESSQRILKAFADKPLSDYANHPDVRSATAAMKLMEESKSLEEDKTS